MKVRDTASIRITQERAESMARTRRARKPATKGKNSALKQIKVDLRVWKTALKIAGGDATRLVVESATSVLVLNHPKRGSHHAL